MQLLDNFMLVAWSSTQITISDFMLILSKLAIRINASYQIENLSSQLGYALRS